MKMARKLIFCLLLAAMIFVLLPATAQAEGGAAEQYNLTPGGTYYFDLSGESLPGTVNDQLPDTSLRWVPFTYVGTINAYSLGAASNNDPLASAKAVASDRSLFVAEYTVTNRVNWGDLNGQNLIFGKSYQSGGISYTLRSLSAGSNFDGRFDPVTPANNEWDRILAKNTSYIKNFLGVNGLSWGQDTVYHDPNPNFTENRPLRGFYTAGSWFRLRTDYVGLEASLANCSFRPALEITSAPSSVLKTITFDMGSDGCLGSQSGKRNPGSLTSATVVYTGSITLPDFTADDRFTYLSSGWGKLRWSDGTNLYEPGKEYDLPTGTVLRPGYETVTEQYNLEPGGIYYFDLSEENIPGDVNYTDGGPYPPYGYWPDTTFKWVPFLYAGTINAYSLNASSSGDPSASINAAASDRSLFVSTCNGFGNVTWDTLNGKGLIFGKGYESGGVSYSLRSMSMGSSSNGKIITKLGAERGLPANNEWDQLLDKDAIYQFRSWNLANWVGYKRYMGQDTVAENLSDRVLRCPDSWGFNRVLLSTPTTNGAVNIFFRPVLEIKSPTGTELKTVTFDMGAGGTLGVNSPSPNPGFDTGPLTSATVVYTGSLTMPEITAANGFNYTGSGTGTLGWYDGTTFYAPGTPATLATGTILTAGYGVDAPAVDAGNSSVSNETTPVSPAANNAFTFTVGVRNAAGDPVSGLNQAAFTITENGAGSLTVDSVAEDGTTGNYTVTARHDTAETITITVEVSGVTITDTLDNVVVQAAADQSDFSVQLETAGDKNAGQPFNLSITGAKGADGSALSGSVSVTVTSDQDGEVHNAALTFTAGTATVPITLTAAGSHTLTVTVTGVTNLETMAAAVAPAGVNAGKSTVSAGTTPASPVINSAFTFTVTVRDAYDNPVSGLAAGDFAITENGAGSLTVDSVAEDGTTGSYTVTASHDAAETITIEVEVSSVDVGSIASVIIRDAAADQSDFSVQLETAGDKNAGQPFNLSITNAKATSGSALSGSINVTVTSDQDGEVHNAPITFTAGTATVPVTLTTAGGHTLTVTVTGVTNPETVNVTVVAAVTTGSISGTVLYDDGGGGSDPLEGATVTVTVGGTDYTATTDSNGTYTISNVPAGSGYTVTASKTGYNDGTVNNVTVTAGSTTANVNFLLATPVNGVIAGVAKDSGNNPISGVTVSLSVSGTVYQGTTDISGTYTISGIPAGSGYAVTASKAGYNSETVNNVTVTAGSTATVDFTLTPASGDVAISIAAIPGVTAPVRGATPVTAITATAQYTGTVTWSPSHAAFAGGTVYTATITLTPKAGYTLTGVGANFFTVAGATSVSHAAGSGVVTAVFPATSSGGGGSGGSGGGGSSSNGTNVTILSDKKPDQPVIAGFSLAPTVNSSGHATVTISQQSVEDAIAKALADAKAQGSSANGIGISLNIDLPDTAKSLGIVLPQATLQSLVSAGVRQLEINGQLISLNLDLEALKEIQRQSTGDVTIAIKPVKNLSAAAKKLIGTRPVYDVTISYVKDGKAMNITSLGKGSATLSLPYKPGKNEAVGWLFGVHVDGKGNATRIPGSAYDVNSRSVILSSNHFSIYGVGYTAPTEKYTDIATHWAKESIDYVVGRGLFSGTTDTNFSPNTAMDRGMLVTVLGRLAGADVSAYKTSSFTDVGAGKYYLPYVEWAYEKGIISGIGNGKFAPERAVTREEIALILQNYAKVTGYKLPITREVTIYADASSIGSVYKTAVTAMQQAGIMMGGLNNKFNPQASAARAEVAAMLHRYVKLTIDPATAKGWVLNDDGQWLYYQDGKAVTGWQTIYGVKHYFTSTGTLQTGWVKDNAGNWHLYSCNKALVGWQDISRGDSKKTYYFTKDGIMVFGKWFQIDAKWYYFNADGSLARSTKVDGYDVDENGIRKEK